MSVQISVDPAGLSQEQREAVAGFILAYPGKACAGTCGHAVAEIHAHTHKGVTAGKITHADVVLQVGDQILPVQPGVAVNELEALQHDHESTMPEAAFGKPDEAAAAFGVPAAPLVGSTPVIAGASTVAPPPPANTAPTTTTPGVASSAAVASSAGVDLDKHGLPWDGRIHAESKAKIADGTWRKKRNVDPGLVAQVEAELRQVMGAPTAPLAVSTAPSVPTPPPVTAAPVTANLPTASTSPAAVPPPPAPAPAPAVGDNRQQFVALIGRTSAALQGGKITQDEINQCCQAAGVPALPLLANRLDLVAIVGGSIDAIIASRP